MQAAKGDVRALPAVVVSEIVGAVGRGDVDLNHDQVRFVREIKRLDVLVLERYLVVLAQVAC